jgi:lipoprotein-anchoring transpeptidase ErfK/SrfK
VTPLLLALLLGTAPSPPRQHASTPKRTEVCHDLLGFQVLLDRAGFSPGEIDGTAGPNLKHALAAFQASKNLTASGTADCETWKTLASGGDEKTVVDYAITADDVKGPFLESSLPSELIEQAKLPALSYASAQEALAERFHTSPQLLARLNPNRRFVEGATIRVPAVTPFSPARPQPDAAAAGVVIKVSRSESTLRAERADGTLVFLAPVSSGSEHDPLPIGDWKVTGIAWMPPFNYNPDLFWDAAEGDHKAVIKPGPNNPVGVAWVDINVPHYGIHGTPSPNLVGHAQSHGCVRLTNWDAARLVALVKPGTQVIFSE